MKTLLKTKLLILLFVFPSVVALLRPGYFPMHDDTQGIRVLQMRKCIRDFQIPCRWVPDMGFGYGYPQFNYYSPLPYYLMQIPVLLGSPILSAVKLGFLVSLAASFYSMYLLGTHIWGKKGGLVSALFYTYAPYRAVDVYARGAMSESWAFVFMPLIFLFTLKKSVLPLALSVAGLLLTHNISTVMFLPFYAASILLFLLLQKINAREIKNIFLAGLWGFSLAAFFVLPAFWERSYVHVNSIIQGYFNYLAHFVGIKQLFLSSSWGYGASSLGELDGMSLSVGILHWSFPVFVLALLFYLRKIKDFWVSLFLAALAFLALFLIHPRSQFIWDNIDIFAYIQFPWRFLGISIFFLALAAGSVAKAVRGYNFGLPIFLFLVLLLVYGSFFKPQRYIDISDEEKFSGASWREQQTSSILDYLPIGATHPPTTAASATPEILGDGRVVEGKTGTDWQIWVVETTNPSQLRLQLFDFPVWTAKIDGRKTATESSGELGLVTLSLPAGTQRVEVQLTNTPLRTISNIISLLGILLIPVYFFKLR